MPNSEKAFTMMIVVVHGRANKKPFKVQFIVIMVIIMLPDLRHPLTYLLCHRIDVRHRYAYLFGVVSICKDTTDISRPHSEKNETLPSCHRAPLSLNTLAINNPTTNWSSPTGASTLLFYLGPIRKGIGTRNARYPVGRNMHILR